LLRLLTVNLLDLAPLTSELNLKNLVSTLDHVRLESSDDELGARSDFTCIQILLRLGHPLNLFNNSLAILWIKSTVKLVHDVEWRLVNLLNGEDEAGCNYGFLPT